MIKTLILIIVGCVLIAVLGALGENMMRYGRENGLIKKNYDDTDGEDKP